MKGCLQSRLLKLTKNKVNQNPLKRFSISIMSGMRMKYCCLNIFGMKISLSMQTYFHSRG